MEESAITLGCGDWSMGKVHRTLRKDCVTSPTGFWTNPFVRVKVGYVPVMRMLCD